MMGAITFYYMYIRTEEELGNKFIYIYRVATHITTNNQTPIQAKLI
jgi:hypothetical protein